MNVILNIENIESLISTYNVLDDMILEYIAFHKSNMKCPVCSVDFGNPPDINLIGKVVGHWEYCHADEIPQSSLTDAIVSAVVAKQTIEQQCFGKYVLCPVCSNEICRPNYAYPSAGVSRHWYEKHINRTKGANTRC